jgi:hypothetical protein
MKYYSNTSMSVTTVRTQGFYPSCAVAAKLATKVAWVIQEEKNEDMVKAIASSYSHGFYPHHFSDAVPPKEDLAFYGIRTRIRLLTPAEQDIVMGVLNWWTMDEDTPGSDAKAYVAVNLNNGRSLCLFSSRERKDVDLGNLFS